MKKTLCAVVALALVVPTLVAAHPATFVVELIWKHLGGKDQYEKARYLEFTWTSEADGKTTSVRNHRWDRYSGDYVVEFKDSDSGDALQIYLNVETGEGTAVRNGETVEGEAGEKLVERGYRIFINDTFWLLCPTKMQDWGARIKFEGHENVPAEFEWHKMTEDERREYGRAKREEPFGHGKEIKEMEEKYHNAPMVIHLWYEEEVGLTPGDQYWLYVLHTGQIIKWHYKLESGREGTWMWSEEKDCGMGITLATKRTSGDGNRSITFSDVRFTRDEAPGPFKYDG